MRLAWEFTVIIYLLPHMLVLVFMRYKNKLLLGIKRTLTTFFLQGFFSL